MNQQVNDTDIAIVGMSGRFPGANNIESFWQNLRDGIESIQVFDESEVLASGVTAELLNQPNYVPVKAVIDGLDCFDAGFFGFSPREAEILDPQQRLFLECAWEALETAGYIPETYDGQIGIFAGAGKSQYFLDNIHGNDRLLEIFSEYQLNLACDREFLATRTAYKLNLTGPAIAVQSACSTSLVAVHLASQSLLSGECDLALAGGVTLKTKPEIGYLYQSGMIFAPDGHCRAFDAQAKGTVGSQGVAIVALKRATEAIAERDFIYALIKGSAINNDGAVKVGYTAPSVDGQARAIAEAQAIAEVDAETVTYIESHGTGTELGDPIEIAALTQAFRQSTERNGFCAIGSLKSNMGHLNHAAGVAGLMKTALALHHRQIPPSLHFETPNPKIDFAHSPFYVSDRLSEWKTGLNPRRAGVSSFGIGGTNAHVVMEEAPVREQGEQGREDNLLVLSAKTSSALETATRNLASYLQQYPETNLDDVAYTLSVGRKAFKYRQALVCSSVDEAIALLAPIDAQPLPKDRVMSAKPSVIFMFPGQGSQYVNMGRDIYDREPVFRQEVDRCAELLRSELNFDLRDVLYPPDARRDWATEQLRQTAIAQPALFTIEYALAQLWQSWGVIPQGFIGHSIGEYVAACMAGVFDLEDALCLVAARGRMMQQLPPGAMLSVPLTAEEVKLLLTPELSIAVVNEPSRCVVSGTKEAIANFQSLLESKGIESRYLHTSHAFHSAMMEPILEQFARRVEAVKRHIPTIPFISNVTGTWITAEQAIAPDYWSQHLRSTVQFARGIERCLPESEILLEVGAGRTLTTFVKRQTQRLSSQRVLTSLRHPKETGSDMAFCLKALGQLWQAGVDVDWESVYQHKSSYRIPLPTYPFERQRYWVTKDRASLSQPKPKLEARADFSNWFYVPSWKRCSLTTDNNARQTQSILVFQDSLGFSDRLSQYLAKAGHSPIQVKMGKSFVREDENSFICNPEEPESYLKLLVALAKQGNIPQFILHCWSLTDLPAADIETIDSRLSSSFYSLLYLVQAYSKQGVTDRIELVGISQQMQDVLGIERLTAATATMLGAIRTIPQEYSNWHCRSVDLMGFDDLNSEDWLLSQLATELFSTSKDSVVAYRGKHRWVQTFEPVDPDIQPPKNTPTLRPKGVYLITGGFGGIASSIARYLAKTAQAKLILLGRSPLSHDDKTAEKARLIEELEQLGSEVLVLDADVGNLKQMERLIALCLEKFDQIDGVVHAAGIPAGGAIELKTKLEVEKTLQAKVHGTLVLDRVLSNIQLDWWVLCSSLTSVLGGFGQIDYCAANAFLDAFSHQQNTAAKRVIAINWDAWQQVGMAANNIERESNFLTKEGAKRDRLMDKLQAHKLGLMPAEGIKVFDRCLSLASSQIIISTQDFEQRRAKYKPQAKPQIDSEYEVENRLPEPVTSSSYDRPNLTTSYQPPNSDLEKAIAQSWEQTLGIKPVGINDDFFELGGDSLTGVQILSNLRSCLQTSISLDSFLNASTVAELAASISRQKTGNNQPNLAPCLVKLRQGNSQERSLFLIHSAGGSVFMYRDLLAHLDSEQTVFGLQPDISNNLAIQGNISKMAELYIDAIKSVQPHAPCIICGHSFGGVVALEIAQQLQAQGEEVELLAVMDSSLKPQENLELNTQIDLIAFLLDMGEKEKKHRQALQNLEPDEQLNYFLRHHSSAVKMLKNSDKTPLINFLKLFKLNHQAMSKYQAKSYSGNVVFLKAKDVDAVTNPNSEQEWLKLTNNRVEVHSVTGNHLTMLNSENAIAIAQVLNQYLP